MGFGLVGLRREEGGFFVGGDDVGEGVRGREMEGRREIERWKRAGECGKSDRRII